MGGKCTFGTTDLAHNQDVWEEENCVLGENMLRLTNEYGFLGLRVNELNLN